MTLKASQLERALRATGLQLAGGGADRRIRLYVVGGSAGLLGGLLSEARMTGDVDVTAVEPHDLWGEVCQAAKETAKELDLPESWLNDECRIYAWKLPLGWRDRCRRTHTFGRLEVWVLDRRDFIGVKVVSAPRRPQDLEDVRAVRPTEKELDFAEEHIDRLEQEHLDPDHSFEEARAIVRALRGGT